MIKPSVVLLGSKPGAVVALEMMIERNWNVLAVVPSDLPSHGFIQSEKLIDVARGHGIPVVESQHDLTIERCDFVFSYMHRFKVKPDTLKLATRGALNFHAAPLPRFGGWAFYNVAILENAETYGVTCHHMDEGFDTGDLVKVREFNIDAEQETAMSLERRAQQEMIVLFEQVLKMGESGNPLPKQAQDPEHMRYMDKQAFMALKHIPQDASAQQRDRIARAFFYPPYECAYIQVRDEKVEVLPRIASEQIGQLYHRDDLSYLRGIASQILK